MTSRHDEKGLPREIDLAAALIQMASEAWRTAYELPPSNPWMHTNPDAIRAGLKAIEMICQGEFAVDPRLLAYAWMKQKEDA